MVVSIYTLPEEGKTWAECKTGDITDTVDNKHASESMQFLGDFLSWRFLETVLTLNGSGYVYFGSANCTDIPVDGQYYFEEVRKSATSYEIRAAQYGSGLYSQTAITERLRFGMAGKMSLMAATPRAWERTQRALLRLWKRV